MQAPHSPAPQPNFVPVSFSPSRITQRSGVSAGASLDVALPLIVNAIVIAVLPWALPRGSHSHRAVLASTSNSVWRKTTAEASRQTVLKPQRNVDKLLCSSAPL